MSSLIQVKEEEFEGWIVEQMSWRLVRMGELYSHVHTGILYFLDYSLHRR